MKIAFATFALILLAFSTAQAAPKPISMDRSSTFLIDTAAADRLWRENTSARVKKLYPATRYRFVSDVGGGFNGAKACVVSARAMLLPVRGKQLIYRPVKSATVFDAVPDLNRAQCEDLARSKLKEAIQAMEDALAAST